MYLLDLFTCYLVVDDDSPQYTSYLVLDGGPPPYTSSLVLDDGTPPETIYLVVDDSPLSEISKHILCGVRVLQQDRKLLIESICSAINPIFVSFISFLHRINKTLLR